jgi:hypothetical protein
MDRYHRDDTALERPMAAPKTGPPPQSKALTEKRQANPAAKQTNSGGNLPRPLLGKSLWLML